MKKRIFEFGPFWDFFQKRPQKRAKTKKKKKTKNGNAKKKCVLRYCPKEVSVKFSEWSMERFGRGAFQKIDRRQIEDRHARRYKVETHPLSNLNSDHFEISHIILWRPSWILVPGLQNIGSSGKCLILMFLRI